MPEFLITSPEGKKYRVTGPEGSTQEDALAQVSSAAQPSTPQSSGLLGDFLKSLGSGIARGAAGSAIASGQAEESLQTGGAPPTVTAPPGLESRLHKPQTGLGEIGGRVGETLGSPPTWLGPESMLAKAGLGALSGVGSAFGERIAGKPGAIIGGMVAPAVPGLAKAGMQGLVRPTDVDRMGNVATLRAAGVEPHAGDVSGRPWLRGLQRADRLTGSYERIAEKPIEQFTAKAAEKIGQVSNRLDDATIDAARRDLGQVFQDTAKKIPINHDKRLGNELVKIVQDMHAERLPDEVRNRIEAVIDQLSRGFESKAKGPAKMSGKTYQAMTQKDSLLDRLQHESGVTRHYANRVASALNEALERTASRSPQRKEAYAALKDARKKWYNMIVLSEVASGSGELASRGLIEPERLRSVLTKGQENKLNYALEKGDLHELARAATSVMSPFRPQGTMMEQMGAYGAPAGLGAAISHFMGGDPFTGAVLGASSPTAIGRAINSPMGQQFLKSQAESPGPDWMRMMLQAGRGGIPQMAEGGIVDQPTLAMVGEKGPEAVIPLDDPAAAAQQSREIYARALRRAVQPENLQGARAGGPPSPQLKQAVGAAEEVAIPGLSAYHSAKQGDYPMAAAQAGLSALPYIGKPLGAAVRAAPAFAKTAGASVAALTSLFTDSSTGRSNLSPQAQERLRMMQEKSKLEQQERTAEAQRRKEEAENKARLEAEAAQSLAKTQADLQAHLAEIEAGKQREQLRIEQERQESERKAAEESVRANAAENKRLAERPFRERHPDAALNLTLGGIAVAALIPGASQAYKKWAFNQYAKEWENLDKIAAYTLKHGTTEEQKLAISRLSAAASKKADQEGKLHKFPWLTQLGSAGAAVEGGLIPSEVDITQPKESEAHKAAVEFFTSPSEWGRLGALYGGGTLAGITAKEAAGAFLPTRGLPMGTEGTVKAAKAQWKSEAARRGAQTRAKKPSNVRKLYEE